MVAATHGVLIQGDVALIEFIRTLDEAQAPADRFVIRGDLGDQALFVKERWVSFIQQKVSEWQKGLRFEPKQGA